jgi:hypothetical protein
MARQVRTTEEDLARYAARPDTLRSDVRLAVQCQWVGPVVPGQCPNWSHWVIAENGQLRLFCQSHMVGLHRGMRHGLA